MTRGADTDTAESGGGPGGGGGGGPGGGGGGPGGGAAGRRPSLVDATDSAGDSVFVDR